MYIKLSLLITKGTQVQNGKLLVNYFKKTVFYSQFYMEKITKQYVIHIHHTNYNSIINVDLTLHKQMGYLTLYIN